VSRPRGQQLRMNVRLYLVCSDGWPQMQVQAATRAAAKYQLFKLAREAGYYVRFSDFLKRGWSARELRR
jgi:hypothetical protein